MSLQRLRRAEKRGTGWRLVVLPIALLVCLPAVAMDSAPWNGGASRTSSRTASPSADAAKNVRDVRRIPKAKKRSSKTAGGSRVRDVGKAKPVATRRVTPMTKAAPVRRTKPALVEALRDSQSSLAEACKQRIETELQPARIVQAALECEGKLSNETLAGEIRQAGVGARQAMEVQRTAGMSADLFAHPEGDPDFHALVRRAARGDMQAAYRIADAYRTGILGVQANPRRMEQWLRFSAELGDGRASWELSEHYNYGGLVADAAKYEKKAEDLGYRPGPRLPSRGY